VTTVVRNGLGVLTRDGDWHVVVEDPREDALAAFLHRLEAGTAAPDDLLATAGPRLQFPTGVCFAGRDLRTVHLVRWPCRGCRPSALPSRANRCATGPEPSERSPAGSSSASIASASSRPNRPSPKQPGRAWPHCNGSSA
jgi:hypothetical protein